MLKTSKYLLTLGVILVWASCKDNSDEFYFTEACCIQLDFEVDLVGERYSSQGLDYDNISVYKIPQKFHNQFFYSLDTVQDISNKCGYWVKHQFGAVYIPNKLVKETGNYYQIEYSSQIRTLVVREINI